jgi:hypothetical protein
VIRRVPWQRHHIEGSVAVAVAQQLGDRSAGGGERSRGEAHQHLRHRLGVVHVVMREQNPAETAALVDLLRDGVQVVSEVRARIDHKGRFAPDYPGVGPVEAERSRVVGANADHIVAW